MQVNCKFLFIFIKKIGVFFVIVFADGDDPKSQQRFFIWRIECRLVWNISIGVTQTHKSKLFNLREKLWRKLDIS
jgi:hypothetical protein